MNSRYIFIILVILSSLILPIYGQVTLGSGEKPERGAVLEAKEWTETTPDISDITSLENSRKGILFPKVMLHAYDLLTPLYGDPDTATANEKLLATGMMVYNVNPNATGLNIGLYYWNGEEWNSMGSSNEGMADFEPKDCESIEVLGTYIVGQPLNPTTNYISLNVNVTKPGSYSMFISTNPDNGYYFSTSGVFQKAGTYIINLPGAGSPISEGQNNLRYSINNHDYPPSEACNKYINVSGKAPDYSFNCTHISASTNLTVNVAPTIDDVIKMRINTPETSAGARYTVNTNQVNGLSFKGEGILTGGNQLITLEAVGIPIMSGTYYFTITTNSTASSTSCPVEIVVKARAMSMAIVGENSMRHPYAPNASANRMLNNASLFGADINAFYPITQLSVTEYLQDMSQSTLRSLLTSSTPPDILFLSYNFIPDATTRTSLVSYVNGGGVLIYSTDQTGTSDARYQAAQTIINGVFNSSNVSFSSGADGPDVMTLLAGNPIVEGLYQDLSGKSFGRDLCCNFGITDATLPADALVLMRGNSNQARSIMHPTKAFVFFGDGGPFSGRYDSTSTVELPCRADANGTPLIANFGSSSTPIYNSYLFVNMMAWAIEYVQTHRPNGGQIITP